MDKLNFIEKMALSMLAPQLIPYLNGIIAKYGAQASDAIVKAVPSVSKADADAVVAALTALADNALNAEIAKIK